MTKPDHIAKYEILDELGRGSFAVVYKARDTTLDRTVALKVLAPHLSWEPDFVHQFRREAKAVAQLHHPHIVVVHEIGEEEGQLYIGMEYIQGRTLAHKLIEEGALPLDHVVTILEQLADALDYAHTKSILHRDVKPGNIMVTEGGRVDLHTTLMDFGLMKAMEGSQYVRTSGQIVGTPEYMSPEQAEGEELDYRSDLYALGVVAYQMSTGQAPFTAPSPLAVLRGHTDKPPPSPRDLNPQLSPEVEQVLLKTLAKKPNDRYQSAGALARALKQAIEAEARARQREEQLAGRYAQLQQAVADQDWPAAEARCREILALDPNYCDVDALLNQTEEGMRREQARQQDERERQAHMAQLYTQLQTTVERKDWPEVLTLGGQIQALEPGYRDVPDLIAQAREQLHRPPPRVPVPTRGWWAGAALLVLLVLLCVTVTLGPQLWEAAFAPTETPPRQSVVTLSSLPGTPTEALTEVFTKVPTTTPTQTHTPTQTGTPTDTPTLTRTPIVITSSPVPISTAGAPKSTPTSETEQTTELVLISPVNIPCDRNYGCYDYGCELHWSYPVPLPDGWTFETRGSFYGVYYGEDNHHYLTRVRTRDLSVFVCHYSGNAWYHKAGEPSSRSYWEVAVLDENDNVVEVARYAPCP